MVETTKIAHRMKRSDGTLALSSPTATAKLPSDSKKRKGSTIKSSGFSGYGIDSDPGEEQDENQPVPENSTAESRLKKGGSKGKSVGEAPPTKKQKTPVVADVHQMAFRNYFTKERTTTTPLSPMPLSQLPLRSIATDDTNRSLTDNLVSSAVDLEAVHDTGATKPRHPISPKEPTQTKERSLKAVNGNNKSVPSTTESSLEKKGSPAKNTIKGKGSKSAATRTPLDGEPSENAPTSTKPTPKRSKSEDDDLDSNELKVEKTVPVRSVRDFFAVKQVVKKDSKVNENNPHAAVGKDLLVAESVDTPALSDDDPMTHATKGANSVPEKENEAAIQMNDIVRPSTLVEKDSVAHVSLPEVMVESTLMDNDGDDAPMIQEPEPEPEPEVAPRRPRRRLFRVSDIAAQMKNDTDEEPTPPKKAAKAVPVVEISSSESDANSPDRDLEPEPEPESADQIAQVKLMRGFFTTKPPTSDTVKPATDSSVKPDRKVPLPKPKKPVPTKSKPRKKRSAFSDSEGSGSEYDSRNSDDDSDREPKEEEKPDPNQKAITSMFTKSLARPTSIYPREPEKKKPKMTARSRSLLSGGLSNYSNTCYLNSVLQTFRNIPGCTETLFTIRDKMEAVEASSGSLDKISEYQRMLFENILQVLRTLDQKEKGEGDDGERTAYPKDVIACLRQGDSLFNTSDQQDAAEFLFYVISLFDDVIKAVQTPQDNAQADTEKRESPEWHPINDLFQVGTQTVAHCQQCLFISTHSDRGIDLTVQIDNDNPTMIRDLEWGISETMKTEHMKDDNQRFCDKCSQKADAHVHHYFTSLPRIMILRLQRYNFMEGAVKLQNEVSCTEEINFSKWMSKSYKGADPRYELCAILIHRGRVITSGHYYVYIKKTTEIETTTTDSDGETISEKKTYQWLKYNDSSVLPVTEEGMAKIFSGKVSGLGAYEGLEETNTSSLFQRLDVGEDDMATPYVYIYQRIDG
ncbi:hypothetical protein EMPS_02636 [Entomortierella parvispora]|uniref:ubiquitinyl hydrolase 1 n=1 Tax=Entomortierella parvispora TaxID=205924 RepID=A0A9P3H594_9FUNG|nr:hypothetical protein EMPS_02636 [Entomortierella parvispora]